MAVYAVGVVFLFYRIGLWDITQLKNTVFWFFTVAVLSLFDIINHEKVNYAKSAVKDVLSFTAILHFIIGIYSFSYFVEVLILPFGALVAGTLTVAERDPQDSGVRKLFRGPLSILGVTLILYTLYRMASDFYSFANKGTLNDFLIPALLSFAFLPLIYVLSIYVSHEDIFVAINRVIKKPALIRFARWKALANFHINKTALRRWHRLIGLKTI